MLIVFDLDGTLVDSRADIVCATNHALLEHGRPALPDELVTSFIGDGARTLMARAAGLREDDARLEPFLQAFLDYYAAHAAVHTTPVPGAVSVLDTLAAGLPLALCTNKPRRTALRVLDALGLRGYFAALSAGGDQAQKKPDPAPLLALGERLGFAPGDMVLVGDGPQDIECARRAGARSVGVAGNIAPRALLERARPDALLEEIRALPGLLHRWRNVHATSR
ncbi:MAG: HAD-IA family hydrolase [Myxococcales bacterium]|nr:HAD-IA family hydrolase [Myxococcales bacterium]